jgi:hypothetical protein
MASLATQYIGINELISQPALDDASNTSEHALRIYSNDSRQVFAENEMDVRVG